MSGGGAGVAAPCELRVEHLPAGRQVLGLGTSRPRLSWRVPDADAHYRQGEYQVRLRHDDGSESLRTVRSDRQVRVPWPFEPLRSRQRCTVDVRVRGGSPAWSGWSAPVAVEVGLLDPAEWEARFVSPRDPPDAAPVLVRRFELPDGVSDGRLRLTAHGLLRAYLNGTRVGDDELAPGWTSYRHRLRHRTHDVTSLLTPGTNRLEVLLGNGWYRGRLGFEGRRAVYGDRLALLAQLELRDTTGGLTVLATDGTWRWRPGRVLADDLYDGEHADLRRPLLGDPADERPVDVLPAADAPLDRLVAAQSPPVRVVERVPAVEVRRLGDREFLVDLGRNVVGRLHVRARGTVAGQRVAVRHAEVLEDGELCTRPLRSARATDTYDCAGGAVEDLRPLFTVHGFRYAQVSGLDAPAAADVTAEVLSSAVARTGWFTSSHPLLDRFHETVVASLRGNLLDVPTDCPQRDERLGWTGDVQVFAPAGSFLADWAGLLDGWLADLAADQHPDGSVPLVVPDALAGPPVAVAGWGDAAVVVPSVLHARHDDVDMLRRRLPAMRAWVERAWRDADDDGTRRGGFQFGDWLDPAAPPDDPFAAATDPDVVATAYLVRSSDLLADVAGGLGAGDLASWARDRAEHARAGFHRRWVSPAGLVHPDTAAGYALALGLGVLRDPELRRAAGDRLADLVRGAGFVVATGFLGTPLLLDALTDTGHGEIAHRLLRQTACPSWLYPVTMGATTVWERWDAMLPDGSVNPGEMTSFNHYALGAAVDWLHRRAAGLAPAAPGYRLVEVRPVPSPGLSAARAGHDSPYGRIEVGWVRAEGVLHLEVHLPVGCRARVHPPGTATTHDVGHGTHRWSVPDPCRGDRGPLRTVRDLVDDERAWGRLVETAVRTGVVRDEQEVARRLARSLHRGVRELASLLDRDAAVRGPGPLSVAVDKLLDELLAAPRGVDALLRRS